MTLLLIPLQIFAQILRAEMHEKAMQRETVRQIEISKIEATIATQTIQAQKELGELLITTARHVFDRKIDVLHASFNAILGFTQRSHECLVSERASLTVAVIKATSKEDKLIANDRLGAVDRELARLEHEAATLHADMQAFLRIVDITLPLPALQISIR
jgi:hypothetical protein